MENGDNGHKVGGHRGGEARVSMRELSLGVCFCGSGKNEMTFEIGWSIPSAGNEREENTTKVSVSVSEK